MYAASKYLYINSINISHFIDIIFYLPNVDRFLGQVWYSIYQKQVVFTQGEIRKNYRKHGISYSYSTLSTSSLFAIGKKLLKIYSQNDQ